MLRKLEQVESARDPSALLRAQFILQAQRKPQPTEPISHGKDTRTVSIRTFWLTLLVSLLALPAHSADLVASVSKNKVVKNEVFQLRVVSHDKVSADALDFSQLEPDFFVGQPSFASSTNIINGNYSQRSEWTVALAAQK